MRKILFILILINLLLISFACEPTLPVTLNQAVEKSDLIIIADHFADGPYHYAVDWPDDSGPEWVEAKIISILKGDYNKDLIRITTNTVCGYSISGLNLRQNITPKHNPPRFILFLKYNDYTKQYDEIFEGSNPAIIDENNSIQINTVDESTYKYSTIKMSLDEIIQKYNLNQIDYNDSVKIITPQNIFQIIINFVF